MNEKYIKIREYFYSFSIKKSLIYFNFQLNRSPIKMEPDVLLDLKII